MRAGKEGREVGERRVWGGLIADGERDVHLRLHLVRVGGEPGNKKSQ